MTLPGIKIADNKMALDLTQFVRDTESDLLFHRSTRVYLFGLIRIGPVQFELVEPGKPRWRQL